MIHIMEYYAVPDSILHSLFEANIKEHCTIKRLCTCLHTENKGDFVKIKKRQKFQYYEKNLL